MRIFIGFLSSSFFNQKVGFLFKCLKFNSLLPFVYNQIVQLGLCHFILWTNWW
ncbi:hypothetical protein MYP_1795 [Sporocytophaga myxococcoides]|uniref:Uncharacterized protein n=1 Tax=Sporocytophaga myxococcoides TaxID=153721 RepID=A0A098LDN8_9BACT|nr:hypothetical protein MYP_1795 [Sporocytophaga myxococcoides]